MAVLNIGSGFDDLRARELSNLVPRPFTIDGVAVRSVEGFLQGIKFPLDDTRRSEVFKMIGVKAKRMGERAGGQFVWWNGQQFAYGSPEHRALLERAIRASFEQNPVAMLLLRSTRGMTLTHDLGTVESPNTSLPAAVFCDVLTRLRDEGDLDEQRRLAKELGFSP